MAETYRPTKGMQDEARKALGWIADGKAGSGFTAVGRRRASDIAAGKAMSGDTVLRMYSFFARHEVDKQGKGFTPSEDGFPSAGRVSWAAWGGDAGFSWSTKIRNQLIKRSSFIATKEGQMKLTQRAEMYSATKDPVLHGAMAADAALDAAQMLIADCEDPIVQQAYLLMCAADAALSEVIEACGGMDEDDEEMDEPSDLDLPYIANEIINLLGERSQNPRIRAMVAQLRAALKVGTKVSWNSSGGTAYGKIESINDGGTAKSSEGFAIKGDSENPAYKIRLYREKADGWAETDITVVHRGDTLTAIADFPKSRSKDNDDLIQERKAAIESAERITFQAEVRAIDTKDGSLRIGGYAATFGAEATGLNFREVIAPGAFKRSLSTDNPVFLLVNHDTENLPLASTRSGTLRLVEDKIGLRMEADLDPANPRAQEVTSALRRGDVDKMSFAFTVNEGGETREEGLRTLTDLNLFEVSVVTMPAYDATSVGMRSQGQSDDLQTRKQKLALKLKQSKLKAK